MAHKYELVAALICFGFLTTLPLIQLQVLDGWEGCYVSLKTPSDIDCAEKAVLG